MRLRQWSSRAARAATLSSSHGSRKVEDTPAIDCHQLLDLDDFCVVEDYDLEGFSGTLELCYETEVRHEELTNR